MLRENVLKWKVESLYYAAIKSQHGAVLDIFQQQHWCKRPLIVGPLQRLGLSPMWALRPWSFGPDMRQLEGLNYWRARTSSDTQAMSSQLLHVLKPTLQQSSDVCS